MNIILHADDFGYDYDTCKCTIELFESGYLSSASIMANMPATKMAIEYARQHPEFSFGVHLTYVDGLIPLSKNIHCNSLLNDDGMFYESSLMRKKAILLKLSKNDIIQESIAQIERIQDNGIKISHLDSHGHLHKFPAFLLALKEVAKLKDINKMRRVQNVFMNRKKKSLSSILNSSFDYYIKQNFSTTDYFYMPANSMDKKWGDKLLSIISNMSSNKIIEIGVHPGNNETWRYSELNDLKEFVSLIKKEDINIINWNQLL